MDNIKSKVTRVYIRESKFTSQDTGEIIEYSRLITCFELPNGKILEVPAKLNADKSLLLSMCKTVDEASL